MQIRIIDPIYCRASQPDISAIQPILSYTTEAWYQGKYHKIRKVKKKSLIAHNGLFLAGFLPRIKSLLPDVHTAGGYNLPTPSAKPSLSHITLRADQENLVSIAVKTGRGILKAPTGIGKTVLSMGFLSCFPMCKSLFLCNEITLLHQHFREFCNAGFRSVSVVGDGSKDLSGSIVIATPWTLKNIPWQTLCDKFDIVIIDECDIGMGIDTVYYKLLTKMLSPIRLGFSATLPENELSRLVMEGLLGPVIGEMTIAEGIELGFLAKPKVTIRMTPENKDVRDLSRYPEVYDKGVVNNRQRNSLLIEEAASHVNADRSVLILVTKVEHGKALQQIAKDEWKWEVPFIWGDVDGFERETARFALSNKEISCVITNVVWKRGINIPSLDVVINAAGEKSETNLIQRLGRGMRVTDNKKEMLIVDIFDPSHYYLVKHFGYRVALYCREGWL